MFIIGFLLLFFGTLYRMVSFSLYIHATHASLPCGEYARRHAIPSIECAATNARQHTKKNTHAAHALDEWSWLLYNLNHIVRVV